MMDWLANLSIRSILIVVGLLLTTRVLLLRADFISRIFRHQLAEIAETFAVTMVMVFLVLHRFVFQLFFIPSASMVPTLKIDDRILVNRFLYRFQHPQRKDIVVFRAPRKASPEPKDFVKRLIGLPGETVAVEPDQVMVDGRPLFPIIGSGEETGQPDLALRVDPTSRVELDGNRLLIGGKCVLALSPTGQAEFRGRDLFIKDRRIHRFDAADSLQAMALPAALTHGGRSQGMAYYQGDGTPFLVLKGEKLAIQPGYVEINGRRLEGESYVAQTPRYRLAPVHLGKDEYFMMGDNRNISDDSHRWGALRGDAIVGKAWAMFWPLQRAGLVN
jgi:signal peptidase I